MRKLIFVRGLPGSGKSTFIDKMKWEPYALSRDQLRLLHRAPEMNENGDLHISQVDAKKIHNEYIKIIKERMGRGEFLVLDGLFVKKPQQIIQLASKYHYFVALLDFYNMDINQVLTQNNLREEYKKVSNDIIKDIYTNYSNNNKHWGNHIHRIIWDKDNHFEEKIKSWLSVPMADLSNYDSVIHVGDIQGCYDVLAGNPSSPFFRGLSKNNFYIFVGDLLDRGVENGKVFRWFLDHVINKYNVVLIHGNHEDHIMRWGRNDEAVSDEFKNNTLPQLLDSGITQKDASILCDKAKDMYWYVYRGKKVLVSHAGLSSVPKNPALISLRQYSKGTGNYSSPVDQIFENNSSKEWFQVHGHRNAHGIDLLASQRSFNLEDQVEFGGFLRLITLTKNGWVPTCYKNKVFNKNMKDKKVIQWEHKGIKVSDKTMHALREHPEIKEKEMIADNQHIVSFNFTKRAFFQASWDDTIVKARGFFINKNTHHVVARGYDKFFNINERAETQLDTLSENLNFPITGFVKENGFLGNVGYDDQKDALFVATKSSSTGDFSQWFNKIIDNQMTFTQKERLSRWLRDNDACMTFEVIDPKNDPHMIHYDKPRLFLLDIFHRSEHTERLPYEKMEKVAKQFHFIPKKKGVVLHDANQFSSWFKNVSEDLTYRFKGNDIEGFVFEDKDGFMTKIKMAHYAFWKKMRSQKDRMYRDWEKELKKGEVHDNKVLRNRKKNPHWQNVPLFDKEQSLKTFSRKWIDSASTIHPMAKHFISWLVKQPVETWKNPITELSVKFRDSLSDDLKDDWKIPFKPFKMNVEDKKIVFNKKLKLG